MKQITKIFSTRMIPTTVRKIFARCMVGLAAALVWGRFFNPTPEWTIATHAFFVLGALFLGMAWFNYLKLDGVGDRLFKKKDKVPRADRKKKHVQKQMIDFAEEEPDYLDHWEPEQLSFCNLMANATSAVIFLVPALIKTF